MADDGLSPLIRASFGLGGAKRAKLADAVRNAQKRKHWEATGEPTPEPGQNVYNAGRFAGRIRYVHKRHEGGVREGTPLKKNGTRWKEWSLWEVNLARPAVRIAVRVRWAKFLPSPSNVPGFPHDAGWIWGWVIVTDSRKER